MSYQSSDAGSTYSLTTYENALGFNIEYNQTSTADQLNAEVHNVDGQDIFKSPEDMFSTDPMANDLAAVDNTIREYWGI